MGGFEFRCSDKEAESVIERWKSQLATKAPGTQRSSADYEKHHIDILSSGQYTSPRLSPDISFRGIDGGRFEGTA